MEFQFTLKYRLNYLTPRISQYKKTSILGAYLDEIDQKCLKQCKQAFIRVGNNRLSRLHDALSLKQADAVKLLPLLFHVNHPMLPGYVDNFTPCGIPNYSPTAEQKQIAKTVSQSFAFKPRAYLSYPISALYIMGSSGTLAQSGSSDIDLWVCLSTLLDIKQKNKLDEKTLLITEWYADLGIELNIYCVNKNDFRKKTTAKMAKDHCGSTLRYLLLDEFYRSAIWLAGQYLMWWIVPTEREYDKYVKRLTNQKHIEASDWIDFGEVKTIPPEEYFTASLWQIYKAIDSPYKSMFKLILLEHYAKQYPCGGLLSTRYKDQIYNNLNIISQNNKTEIFDQFDPYVIALKFVEDGLKDKPVRLEFLHRCFYLKVGVKHKSRIRKNWRQKIISNFIDQWQWNEHRISYLNLRHQWRIDQAISETQDMFRELTLSYQFLMGFSRLHGVTKRVEKIDLLTLGRKLYANFERRNGKIDKISNGISKNLLEQSITLGRDSRKRYSVYLGQVSQKQQILSSPVHSSDNLFECVAWSVVNGVVNKQSLFQLNNLNNYNNQLQILDTVKNIELWLKASQSERFNLIQSFEKTADLKAISLFINLNRDPLAIEKRKNQYSVVAESDCLTWSAKKINLVDHFDILTLNSWGECITKHYAGDIALLNLFSENINQSKILVENTTLFFHDTPKANEIRARILSLFTLWHKLYIRAQRTKICQRYLMVVGKKWITMDIYLDSVSVKTGVSQKRWLNLLSDKPDKMLAVDRDEKQIEIYTDKWLPISPFLQTVLKRSQQHPYDCYLYQESKNKVILAIKSEKGLVFYREHNRTTINNLVGHYRQFISKIQNRTLMNTGLNEITGYYEFDVNQNGKVRVSQLKTEASQISKAFLLVQAIAVSGELSEPNKIQYDFFTEKESYIHSRDKSKNFKQLAKALIAARRNAERYPIFITDLDLSAIATNPDIMEIVKHKQHIEDKLNNLLTA